MQNIYPLFGQNRILKKEFLWSLRDYAFLHTQLEYQSYGDGILEGCRVEVREKELAVGKGMVKYNGFIYLLTEELTVPYEAAEKTEILKMQLSADKRSEDYISYGISLILTQNTARKENEIEVCRYKLRHGSKLRSQYKGFEDMATEFDTVNVIEADWGAIGGKTISPEVTRYYAGLVLEEGGAHPEDINFAYLCLSQTGAMPVKVVEHYIKNRLEKTGHPWNPSGAGNRKACDNKELFHGLNQILDFLQKNRRGVQQNKGIRNRIMLE
ncbi:MAG TPA: DNA and RNA helicase [Lachnospiraceae bacterium]|nr:DNA and RNA helicase [Lachnospiraceae bacterium]